MKRYIKSFTTDQLKQQLGDNYPEGGYLYIFKHGIGPGTIPRDVQIVKTKDLPNGYTAVWLDRFLTTFELGEYDIPPETDINYYLGRIGYCQKGGDVVPCDEVEACDDIMAARDERFIPHKCEHGTSYYVAHNAPISKLPPTVQEVLKAMNWRTPTYIWDCNSGYMLCWGRQDKYYPVSDGKSLIFYRDKSDEDAENDIREIKNYTGLDCYWNNNPLANTGYVVSLMVPHEDI